MIHIVAPVPASAASGLNGEQQGPDWWLHQRLWEQTLAGLRQAAALEAAKLEEWARHYHELATANLYKSLRDDKNQHKIEVEKDHLKVYFGDGSVLRHDQTGYYLEENQKVTPEIAKVVMESLLKQHGGLCTISPHLSRDEQRLLLDAAAAAGVKVTNFKLTNPSMDLSGITPTNLGPTPPPPAPPTSTPPTPPVPPTPPSSQPPQNVPPSSTASTTPNLPTPPSTQPPQASSQAAPTEPSVLPQAHNENNPMGVDSTPESLAAVLAALGKENEKKARGQTYDLALQHEKVIAALAGRMLQADRMNQLVNDYRTGNLFDPASGEAHKGIGVKLYPKGASPQEKAQQSVKLAAESPDGANRIAAYYQKLMAEFDRTLANVDRIATDETRAKLVRKAITDLYEKNQQFHQALTGTFNVKTEANAGATMNPQQQAQGRDARSAEQRGLSSERFTPPGGAKAGFVPVGDVAAHKGPTIDLTLGDGYTRGDGPAKPSNSPAEGSSPAPAPNA